MKNSKGCVYFFRHIGLSPVKIGYSEEPSPTSRFTQFKTYAPYGSEILGFIQSYEAKKLETILHEKFSIKRLMGEWFEINEEDVKIQMELYCHADDVENKRKFELAWAKRASGDFSKIHLTNKEEFFEYFKFNERGNKTSMAKMFKVNRKTIYNWVEEFEVLFK